MGGGFDFPWFGRHTSFESNRATPDFFSLRQFSFSGLCALFRPRLGPCSRRLYSVCLMYLNGLARKFQRPLLTCPGVSAILLPQRLLTSGEFCLHSLSVSLASKILDPWRVPCSVVFFLIIWKKPRLVLPFFSSRMNLLACFRPCQTTSLSPERVSFLLFLWIRVAFTIGRWGIDFRHPLCYC